MTLPLFSGRLAGLALVLTAGCGGVSIDRSGETGGAGAFPGSGGSGASGGQRASGGRLGAGGLDCRTVDCAYPLCGPGETALASPGSCCPTCQPCPPVACPGFACQFGEQSVTQPAECCASSCQPVASCANAYNAYQRSHDLAITEAKALYCQYDQDCIVEGYSNACDPTCYVVANAGSIKALIRLLGETAARLACDKACGPQQPTICPPSPTTICESNTCVTVNPRAGAR
jgi:hypothetical protein